MIAWFAGVADVAGGVDVAKAVNAQGFPALELKVAAQWAHSRSQYWGSVVDDLGDFWWSRPCLSHQTGPASLGEPVKG